MKRRRPDAQVMRLACGSLMAVVPSGDAVMVAVELPELGVVTLALTADEACRLSGLLDLAALEVQGPRKFELKAMRGGPPA